MIITLCDIPCELTAESILTRLHIEADSEDAADICALIKRAQPLAHPKALLREAFVSARGADTVTVESVTFTSKAMRANLASIDRIFPYIATCGTELDKLHAELPDEFLHYALDCIKEVALGAAIHATREYVASHFGLEKFSSMSPGSGDAEIWPIQQQSLLFSLLGDVLGTIGVLLTKSSLMCPNKTVSGILFAANNDYAGCMLCHRENCPNRHAPFDETRWKSIN